VKSDTVHTVSFVIGATSKRSPRLRRAGTERSWQAFAIAVVTAITLLLAACGSATSTTSTVPPVATATNPPAVTAPANTAPAAATRSAPAPTATADAAQAKSRIIDQTTGWPRKIEALNGTVTVAQKPLRVMTLSVGYDEITLDLVDPSRIAGISMYTADPTISNVADRVTGISRIGRGAEQVLAAKPDLVIADPFTDKNLVQQVQQAGVTVAVLDLVGAYDGFTESIRLFAYLYGEDQRGADLIQSINDRLGRIDAVVAKHASEPKPRVLILQGNAYVAGAGSNMDGIIRRAGGINVAAESGISGTKQISLESIIAMNPDTIIVPGTPEQNAKDFAQVTDNPALASVPAVRNKRIAGATSTYLFTLSHWNVRAMEELVHVLYPNG
jgi:iron complex transport system substrate-binding protein